MGMFLETVDQSRLRQGDIIKGLFYPELNCSDIQLLGNPSSIIIEEQQANLSAITDKKLKEGLMSFTAQLKVYCGFFIILSQCCDLTVREGQEKPNISAFVASPLIDIPYGTRNNTEQLKKLQLNSPEEFTSFFYIFKHPNVNKDYVVDFNRVTAFPRSQYQFLLKQKVLQMTDEYRVKFKIKLGSHFARPTQEEENAGLW